MNYYDEYTWEKMLNLFPSQNYNVEDYHKILHPDFPSFLNKYLELPLLKRLAGIGLLCGTDWTKLYKNRFYYSRLDHSVGVALIIWHFTQDKAQTIAGLLHDVSTPVFSHVSDFRKGDALTQTATEEDNTSILQKDKALLELLKQDGLTIDQVENYHNYPIADNEIPQLSADRLEYMYPSGMALEGSWTLDEVRRTYNDIVVLKNENDQDELGFKTVEIAEEYCQKFCMTGHVLQLNENKLTLHLLGQIMNEAVRLGLLSEEDFMTLSEADLLKKLESSFETMGTDPAENRKSVKNGCESIHLGLTKERLRAQEIVRVDLATQHLMRLYNTFRNMTSIEHTDAPKNPEEYFCISLKVKQRYINPLVMTKTEGTDPAETKGTDLSVKRLSDVSTKAKSLINDFLSYQDTAFGCVKLI